MARWTWSRSRAWVIFSRRGPPASGGRPSARCPAWPVRSSTRWRQQLLLIRADIEAVVDFADEPGVAEEACAGHRRAASATLLANIGAGRRAVRLLGNHPGRRASGPGRAAQYRQIQPAQCSGAARGGDRLRPARHDAGCDRSDRWISSGIPVILTDTAGLRPDVADRVEAGGDSAIARAYCRCRRGDLGLVAGCSGKR